MQTLGLSDSTPRSEGRLKSLFWPSIQTSNDVDYLGAQGYWVCAIVGLLSAVFLGLRGQLFVGVLVLLFYFLSGVGVREGSCYAAGCVLATYAGETLASPSIVRVLLTGLLLSNFRATWIAAGWRPESEQADQPPRWGDTWSDKFADKLPRWLWPKVRIAYYVLSVVYAILVVMGLSVMFRRSGRPN